jgi:biopolymer transport protein ExbD
MFPASRRARSSSQPQEDLNITPIMNVFMILVPFLLLTAAFAQTAMVDLSLPVSADSKEQQDEELIDLNLRVSIIPAGLRVEGTAASLELVPRLSDGGYDFDRLATQLTTVRKSFPDERAVVVAASPSIRYQTVVQVMDRCKAVGFSDISVGPADPEVTQ